MVLLTSQGHVTTWYVVRDNTDDFEMWGRALLFENNHMILYKDWHNQDPTEIISGGQEGMMKYLKNHGLRLNNERDPSSRSKVGSITKLDMPNQETKERFNMAFDSLSKGQSVSTNDSGYSGAAITVVPWTINNHTRIDITDLLGKLEVTLKPWIIVVDSGGGDISALLDINEFKTQQTKMNNSVSISHMMEGGRSGAGYIMVILLPDLQADMLVEILNKPRRGAMMGEDSKMVKYIMNEYPMVPLPEFKKRHDWMRSKIAEHTASPNKIQNIDPESLMFEELKTKIQNKSPDVYDLSPLIKTYDDTKLMKLIEQMHK